MVRLKAEAPTVLFGQRTFQFHYGTIKRDEEIELRRQTIIHFNSTMVRLKDRGADARRIRGGISIPLWYD